MVLPTLKLVKPNRELVVKLALWMIVLAGLAVRIWSPMQASPMDRMYSDPARHFFYASHPEDTQPFKFIDPPGYQLWLTEVIQLTAGKREALNIYAGALSLLTACAWYAFFRELFAKNKTIALIGFAIIAWLPSWIEIYSYFMTETLLLPLLGLALWSTCRTLRTATVQDFAVTTVLWLVAAVTRPVVLPMAAVALLWCWLINGSHRWRKALCALSISAIILIPLGFRSQSVLGRGMFCPFGASQCVELYSRSFYRSIETVFHNTWSSGAYTYGFTSPSMSTHPLAPFSNWESERKGELKVEINLDSGKLAWDHRLAQHTPSIARRLKIMKENAIFFMLGESWPDNNPEDAWASAAKAMRWIWLPLFLVVLAGNLYSYKKSRKLELIPALTIIGIIVCLVASMAVYEGRYRKPFEGMLIANALLLVANIINKKTEQGKTPKTTQSAAFVDSTARGGDSEFQTQKELENAAVTSLQSDT